MTLRDCDCASIEEEPSKSSGLITREGPSDAEAPPVVQDSLR